MIGSVRRKRRRTINCNRNGNNLIQRRIARETGNIRTTSAIFIYISGVRKKGHTSRKLSLSQDSYINQFQMSPYHKKLLHDLGS